MGYKTSLQNAVPNDLLSICSVFVVIIHLSLSLGKEIHYCDSTNKTRYLSIETECPTLGARSLAQINIPWGHPNRAWLTVPPEVIVKKSSIPGSGLGVYSKTFIPAFTWLADYQGQCEMFNKSIAQDYAWASTCNNTFKYIVDGKSIHTSNWLRWLNCPRNPYEENIKVRKCFGKLYYMTSKLILPGQELMVYYGDSYASKMEIDIHQFKHNWGFRSGSKPGTCPSPLSKKDRTKHIYEEIVMKALHINRKEAIQALEKNDYDMEQTMLDLMLGDLQNYDEEYHKMQTSAVVGKYKIESIQY